MIVTSEYHSWKGIGVAYKWELTAGGAVGYVLKDETEETVVRVIRSVVEGDAWLSRPVVEKLARLGVEDPGLISREWQVLDLMARGWDNARIATELRLAEQTIRNHASNIYTKLNANSRAEAVVWAREWGLGRA